MRAFWLAACLLLGWPVAPASAVHLVTFQFIPTVSLFLSSSPDPGTISGSFTLDLDIVTAGPGAQTNPFTNVDIVTSVGLNNPAFGAHYTGHANDLFLNPHPSTPYPTALFHVGGPPSPVAHVLSVPLERLVLAPSGYLSGGLTAAFLLALPNQVITAPLGTLGETVVDTSIDATYLRGGFAQFYVSAVPAVPVPAALPLFASGLGLLAWAARRRRKPAA
jgi:hypothetical protein